MNNKLKKIGENISLLPILLILTLPFVIKSSVATLPFILLFTLIILYYSNRKFDTKEIIRDFKPLLIVILTYIAYCFFQDLFQDYSSARLRALIFCFIFVIAISFRQIKNKKHIYKIFLISNILSACYVSYVRYIINTPKHEWIITASTISAITVALTLLSLLSLIKNYSFKDKSTNLMLSLTIFFGLLSSLMSITRSGWVALIFVSLYILFNEFDLSSIWKKIKKRHILITTIILAIIIEFIIKDRIIQTWNDLQTIYNGNFVTSIGLRLQMWKTALILSQEGLLFGVPDRYETLLVEYAQAGKIHPHFEHWIPNHFHSEYFDRLNKMGIVGMALFYSMLFMLVKEAKNRLGKVNHVTVLILSLLCSGLTDRSFELLEAIPIYFLLSFYYLETDHYNKEK